MGAGKTTIGRKLAKSSKLAFFDSDHEIEEKTGADIPWIFEIEGEDGFRKRESMMIGELLINEEPIVLATGGGAVLSSENRRVMKENGLVIYLSSSPEKILKRTQNDKRRPLLQTDDRLQIIKDIIHKREPLYREIADVIIETNKLTINQAVKKIKDKLKIDENN